MSDYSLSGLARSLIEQVQADLHTCLPARVLSIDTDQQRVTVQPTIKARYTDADGSDLGLQDMPPIPNVQLVFMGSDHATMTFPVKVGSKVLLFFCERSLDNFSYSDGSSSVDPADLRMHDYNDAFALCGMFTFPTALGMHPEDTVIRMNAGEYNESKLSFKPNGDIVFDSSTNLTINTQNATTINASSDITLNAVGDATVTANLTTINSDTTINGDVHINGKSYAVDHLSSGISGSGHTHPFKAKTGTDSLVTNAPS